MMIVVIAMIVKNVAIVEESVVAMIAARIANVKNADAIVLTQSRLIVLIIGNVVLVCNAALLEIF